jgi:hypothetical protein
MDTVISKWRPSWWSDEVHGSAWDRIKEAMRRDWMQTKHDLGVGGHQMNQSLIDTVKQAARTEHLPSINEANPPKVIGEWSEAEIPYGYGYAARTQFGVQHPQWNEGLEQRLKGEWMGSPESARPDWDAVRGFVRRGYEYDDDDDSPTLTGGAVAGTRPARDAPSRD